MYRPSSLVVISFVLLVHGTLACADDSSRGGGWSTGCSASFRVFHSGSRNDAMQLATRCEGLRRRAFKRWTGGCAMEEWSPRCHVYVHSDQRAYARTVGRDAGRSVGCATTRIDGGRVVHRRIDIRRDADNWHSDALPHELTHVVLADLFVDVAPPAWFDEGAGVLAESSAKRTRRNEALAATRLEHRFDADGLLRLDRYPRPSSVQAFYAQSASLVHFLLQERDAATLVEFATASRRVGIVAALRTCYGVDSTAELNDRWVSRARDSAPWTSTADSGGLGDVTVTGRPRVIARAPEIAVGEREADRTEKISEPKGLREDVPRSESEIGQRGPDTFVDGRSARDEAQSPIERPQSTKRRDTGNFDVEDGRAHIGIPFDELDRSAR